MSQQGVHVKSSIEVLLIYSNFFSIHNNTNFWSYIGQNICKKVLYKVNQMYYYPIKGSTSKKIRPLDIEYVMKHPVHGQVIAWTFEL